MMSVATPRRLLRVSAWLAVLLTVMLTVLLAGCDLPRLTTIAEIQGADHRSPLTGQIVTVRGIVVAEGTLPVALPVALASPDSDPADRMQPVCWIEEEDDGDPATSRGLLVTGASASVGRTLRVTGQVVERSAFERELTVTSVAAHEWLVEPDDGTGGMGFTPSPTVLGVGGREIPSRTIDDDGLTRFDPETDGIDFWESLEGMRVRVPDPVVVGATKHGSLYVAVDGGADAGPRTAAGGLRLTEEDLNPERIQIADLLLGRGQLPDAAAGDRFAAAIEGVVHYRRGHFELLPSSLPTLLPAATAATRAAPAAQAGRLRVASFNVLNLSADDHPKRFERVARRIVSDLRAPELVALQEVQDDNGPTDDGTVSADRTLGLLVQAVRALGGPEYRWSQVDPENHGDGGQPGGNIRVAVLYDPGHLKLADLPPAGFDSNPAVLDDNAFRGQGRDGWSNSRKPLIVHLEVLTAGVKRSLYVVALHLVSKGGDDSEWGGVQPPRRFTETQRTAQAEAVAQLVADLQSADANGHIIVAGDLNEYPFRPPLRVLEEAGLRNLVMEVPEDERYTYVYRGNSIVLDYILVTPALARDAEVAILHVHADQPASRQTSDHDPVVASLALD